MRALFSLVGLLVVLGIIALLMKKQVNSAVLMPTSTPPGVALPVTTPGATAAQQSQQIQDQFKASLDAAMQQTRPVEDAK